MKLIEIISVIFAISKNCIGFNYISGKIYCDVFQLIFKIDCPVYSRYMNRQGVCELSLIGDTFGFQCSFSKEEMKSLFGRSVLAIAKFEGTCKLESDGLYMYRCLAQRQGHGFKLNICALSEQLYQEIVFRKCKNLLLHSIHIHTTNNTDIGSLNSLTNNFPHLEQLQWHMREECQLVNQVIGNLKYLKRLHIAESVRFEDCKHFHLQNITQLKELQISANTPSDNQRIFNFSKTFLSGTTNLERFQLRGTDTVYFIKFDIHKEMFNGLRNLSEIIFENCSLLELFSDHLNDLINLKSLQLRTTWTRGIEWMRSKTLQNNLECLHFSNTFTDHEIMEYIELYYVKLAKVHIFPHLGYIGWIYKNKIKAFICFDQLESTDICTFSVDINKKQCPYGCVCNLELPKMRFKIDCDDKDYVKHFPISPIPIIGNASLHLNNKSMTQLPNSTLYGYFNLRELHVASNKFTHLTVAQLPPNLTYLDLRNNSLQTLDKQVLEHLSKQSHTIRLRLSGNPWICNCASEALILFIADLSNQIEDRDSIECYEENLKLMDYALKKDICVSSKTYVIIILGSLVGIGVLIFAYFYFKRSIIMWLYERNLCVSCISRPEPENDNVLRIDAFLAFSHFDSELVEEYVEKLESSPRKFRLSFYQRDWLIGESIPACILQAIEESKRTIILMTKNFVQSSWGRFEFRMAIQATSINRYKRLIIIVYPEVDDFSDLDSELRTYMKFNTYLKRDDPQFWRKLIYAMPHIKKPSLTNDQKS